MRSESEQNRPQRYHRKKLNLSVKREFQKWLIIRVFGIVVLSSAIAALILYYFSHQEVSSSFYTAHIHIRRVSDLLLPVMAAGALVSLLSGMLLAIFLPQKIAGPIYRVQRSLETIKDGDLTERVSLRQGDTLKDLADSVNETTEGLQDRIQAIKEIHAELEGIITTLDEKNALDLMHRQRAALDSLRT